MGLPVILYLELIYRRYVDGRPDFEPILPSRYGKAELSYKRVRKILLEIGYETSWL